MILASSLCFLLHFLFSKIHHLLVSFSFKDRILWHYSMIFNLDLQRDVLVWCCFEISKKNFSGFCFFLTFSFALSIYSQPWRLLLFVCLCDSQLRDYIYYASCLSSLHLNSTPFFGNIFFLLQAIPLFHKLLLKIMCM